MNNSKVDNGKEAVLQMTADIVSAYLSRNAVQAHDLSSLISSVYRSLQSASENRFKAEEDVAVDKPKPHVSVRKSVEHDHIICLEDGLKFKTLKRHLKTHHDMTPEEYREKWSLPADYPIVAPAYADLRSRLAKDLGLGQIRRKVK